MDGIASLGSELPGNPYIKAHHLTLEVNLSQILHRQLQLSLALEIYLLGHIHPAQEQPFATMQANSSMELEKLLPESDQEFIKAWRDKRKQHWEQVGVENIELLYHIDVSPQGDCFIRDSFFAVPGWEKAFTSKSKSRRVRDKVLMATPWNILTISLSDLDAMLAPVFEAAILLFNLPRPQNYRSLTMRESLIDRSELLSVASQFGPFERLPPELQLQILEEHFQIHEANKLIRYQLPHLIRLWLAKVPLHFNHWYSDLCSEKNMRYAGRIIQHKETGRIQSNEFYRPRNLDFHSNMPHIASFVWSNMIVPSFDLGDKQDIFEEIRRLEQCERSMMPDGPVGSKFRLMKYLEKFYWYRQKARASNNDSKPCSWLPMSRPPAYKAPRIVLFPLTRIDQKTKHLSYWTPPWSAMPSISSEDFKISTASWLVLYPDELDCILDNMEVFLRPGSVLKGPRKTKDVKLSQLATPDQLDLEHDVSCMIGKWDPRSVLMGPSQRWMDRQIVVDEEENDTASTPSPGEQSPSDQHEPSTSELWGDWNGIPGMFVNAPEPKLESKPEPPKPKAKTWATHLFG